MLDDEAALLVGGWLGVLIARRASAALPKWRRMATGWRALRLCGEQALPPDRPVFVMTIPPNVATFTAQRCRTQ